MPVRIITDSTSEISQVEAAALDLDVVPIKSVFADREYREGIDMMAEDFYPMLEAADILPTTSQPSPGSFEKVFREALEAGDDIVVATISSKLSGTWQSACIAKEALVAAGVDAAANIHVIDSENTTIGLNILMKRAIAMRDEGKSAAEIAQMLEEIKAKIRLYAVVDTLEYLHRGGRLSAAAKTAGTLLKVKPLIAVDGGEIKVVGKSRGLKKAYDEIIALVEKSGGIDYEQPVGLGYTGDEERLDQFEEVCKDYFVGELPPKVAIGCAIGTHVGPGAVAIAFFVK